MHRASSFGTIKSLASWQVQKLLGNTSGQETSSESEMRLTVLQLFNKDCNGSRGLSGSIMITSSVETGHDVAAASEICV